MYDTPQLHVRRLDYCSGWATSMLLSAPLLEYDIKKDQLTWPTWIQHQMVNFQWVLLDLCTNIHCSANFQSCALPTVLRQICSHQSFWHLRPTYFLSCGYLDQKLSQNNKPTIPFRPNCKKPLSFQQWVKLKNLVILTSGQTIKPQLCFIRAIICLKFSFY